MSDLSMPPPERWGLEHRIPLAVLLTVLTVAVGGVWSASAAFSRLGVLEQERTVHGARLETLESSRMINQERIGKAEQRAADMIDALRRIEGKVDRLVERH